MPSKPHLIAITGTIGSGKSLVGTLLSQKGFTVIDTDAIVHELLEADQDLIQAIKDRFGEHIVRAAGSVDRHHLGTVVFADQAARADLESIVHPAVRAECKRRVAELSSEPVIFLLIPLLYEAGLGKTYDQVWTVVADEAEIRLRLRKRDGMTSKEINQRLAAQWSQEKKAQSADHVIDNSGTMDATREQVEALLATLPSVAR